MTAQPPGIAAAFRVIHAAMTAGLTLTGTTFVLVLRFVRAPVLAGHMAIGLALAGAGAAALAVAALGVRPRVPERAPGQAADPYWTAVDTRVRVIVLWAIVEGSGLVALVGYLLTGGTLALGVGVAAVATLLVFRPTRLEGEGAV